MRNKLISEYRAYKAIFDQAPNMWSTPSVREQAGFCLQFPAPIQVYENLAPQAYMTKGYWRDVRKLIEQALSGHAAAVLAEVRS